MKYLKYIISCLINIWICLYPSNNYDLAILGVYFLVLSISSYIIFFDERKISLNIVFYLFIYFFFGIAPVIQYKEAVFFFGDKTPLINIDFMFGGCVTLFVIGIYTLSYRLINNKITINLKLKDVDYKYKTNNLPLVLTMLTVLIVFLHHKNFMSLFFRYSGAENVQFIDYFMSTIEVSISLLPLLFLAFFKQKGGLTLKSEIILLICIILFNFPTAVSRYELGLVYFTLGLIYFKYVKIFFKEIFILGLLFVFPFVNRFRHKNDEAINGSSTYSQFKNLHFDSFQNTIGIMKEEIITCGDQLIASLFFFIPRVTWEGKPKSSASLLCDEINYEGFCNIAVSFFGEGYINFGFIGVVLFIIILAFYNSLLDKCYYNNDFNYKHFYFLFIFHEFYLLRGSLTAASIKFSIIVLALILFLIINKHILRLRI